MNFVCFDDEKLFTVSALSNSGRYEARRLASQKLNHLVISVCQCIALLVAAKVKLQARERDRFGGLLGLFALCLKW